MRISVRYKAQSIKISIILVRYKLPLKKSLRVHYIPKGHQGTITGTGMLFSIDSSLDVS